MIVNHLPEIMDQAGMSIRELSRETGITYTTIRAVYHGERRSVQLDVLGAICGALGVQPGDIYEYALEGAQSKQKRPAKRSQPDARKARDVPALHPAGGPPAASGDGWKNW